MTNLLGNMRYITLGLCLLVGSSQAFAEHAKKNDAEMKEEIAKFAEENQKLRTEQIQTIRDLHVKHINEYYDKKLANCTEVGELWKQIKPGDKAGNDAVKKQIEEKQKAFKADEEKFKKDFKENVLKVKNKAFSEMMKERGKNMQKKYKD